MDSSASGRSENLNDSWVELYFQHLKEAGMDASGHRSGGTSGTHTPTSLQQAANLQTSQMEKLLMDAARESSRSSSRNASSLASSRASPKSPHSPNNEMASDCSGSGQEGSVLQQVQAVDWIWDWSSRPEANPPSDWNGSKFQHQAADPRSRLSMRRTRALKSGPFSAENLPKLLLTHAATFFLGAALMFAYLKKCCNWSSALSHVTTHALD